MIDTVVILGGGTCGCQIAWQCALHGVAVSLVELDDLTASKAQQRLDQTAAVLADARRWSDGELAAGWGRLRLLDQQRHGGEIDDAVRRADLLIESVPEVIEIKRAALARVSPFLSPQAIVTTNSSYLLPSVFIRDVPDASRLASLHFHVPVWYANAVDIMPHNRTSPDVVNELAEFAKRIDQTPIRLRREQPGYVFNSLLNPLLTEAIGLARRGIAGPEEIDLAWRVITKMNAGPFDMIRLIGPRTVATILRMGAVRTKNPRLKLDAEYLEQIDLPPSATPVPLDDPVIPHQTHWIAAPLDTRITRLPRRQGPLVVVGDAAEEISRAINDCLSQRSNERAPCRVIQGWPEASSLTDAAHLVWHLDQLSAEGDDERLLSCLQAWWIERLGDAPERATTLTLVSRDSVGLSGLVRAMTLELAMHRRFFPAVRLLEYDQPTGRGEVAKMVVEEISIAQGQVLDGSREETLRRYAECQIRYSTQGRMRPCFFPSPWWNSAKVNNPRRLDDLRSRLEGTRWLLIGGGRGITFEMAAWLGNHGCHVNLVNRSRPALDFDFWDDNEIREQRRRIMREAYQQGKRPDTAWAATESAIELSRNLDRLRRAQVSHHLHPLDVSSPAAEQELGRMLANGQPIDGIVYGAGWERTCRFEKKSEQEISLTLRSKLLGLRRLIQAIDAAPEGRWPRWLVVSGSLSGMFGGNGQIDYAHANSRAAALLLSAAERWPQCQSLWIDWPGWEQVGMAERGSSKFMLRKAGHRMITVDEGLKALRDALEYGGQRERVVLIRPSEIPNGLREPNFDLRVSR